MSDISKGPAMGGPQQHIAASTSANQRWWPNQLNLKVLNQNAPQVSPMNDTFNYVEEFKDVDLEELSKDIEEVMTTSQEFVLEFCSLLQNSNWIKLRYRSTKCYRWCNFYRFYEYYITTIYQRRSVGSILRVPTNVGSIYASAGRSFISAWRRSHNSWSCSFSLPRLVAFSSARPAFSSATRFFSRMLSSINAHDSFVRNS